MSRAVLVCALLVSTSASAAVPRAVGRPMVRNPSFSGVANTMMYTVTVKVDSMAADADHVAMVGFVPSGDYTTCTDAASEWKWAHEQVYDTADTRTWTLYNFVPGTSYHYKWLVGDPAGTTRAQCGPLTTVPAPTPKLPTALAALNLQYEIGSTPYDTDYVLLETADCGSAGMAKYYVVAIDPVNEAIVWYLDVGAASGVRGAIGSGLRYQAGAVPADDRIRLTVANQYAYEWSFDGTATRVYDFGGADECNGSAGSIGPCIHHDIATSDLTGRTYAVAAKLSAQDPTGTAWDTPCPSSSRFLDEGYLVLDEDWALESENYLMADHGYDPSVDGGPDDTFLASARGSCDSQHWNNTFDPAHGVIDWTHENSLMPSSYGGSEVVDLSLKEWDQIIRFDAETGALLWTLSPNAGYSDWGRVRIAAGIAGLANFKAQHDVHATGADSIMMFDNRGETTGSRVIEVELTSRPLAATITKSWAVVDAAGAPVRCAIEGTSQQVPGSGGEHVLTLCNDQYAVVEMDDATGNTGTPPPLYISLPDGTTDDFCTSGGPADRDDLQGWHRGFPMANVGEF